MDSIKWPILVAESTIQPLLSHTKPPVVGQEVCMLSGNLYRSLDPELFSLTKKNSINFTSITLCSLLSITSYLKILDFSGE